MAGSKLVSLYGDDEQIYYTEAEALHGALCGEMPDSFYDRNSHVEPELLGGAIAGIIKGIVEGVASGGISIAKMAQAKRAQRRDMKNQQSLMQQQTQAQMATAAIESQGKQRMTIIPVAIGAAALIAVVLLMKGKK